MNTKITARNFFLHLGLFVTFYASVIALITLLFEVINVAYPKITNAYQYFFPSISLQVATLIVAFPLFLFLAWQVQKIYSADPSLHEGWLRRWLSFLTLFIAGAVVAGDLISVIYMFLDGQELTTGFMLKILVLLVVAGAVFFYFLREIRNVISPRERNIWRVVSVAIVLGSIILGFFVLGTPQAQRERRYDAERVSDLQSLQWQVINYWQQKGELPETLAEAKDPISELNIPTDPRTGDQYEYEVTGRLSFRLCANFDRVSVTYGQTSDVPMYTPEMSARYPENWQHEAGRQCYDRTIDPDFYPPTKTLRQ